MTDPVELLKQFLDNFAEGEWGNFPGEISPDFVLYLPFVPAGIPTEIKGREIVRQTLQETAKSRSKLTFFDKVILRTEDPELFVTRAKGEAQMANGNMYRNSYVMFTRIRDGMVLEHTEYLNPLALIEASQ